ncbi:HTTM domain-containing protein [Curtobacterium sp. MCPF17_046]|uniref:HTTM domain-containing protein n=1 Tax=Curtobacterium sp. MCPF17_046 TaxID=2175663 RepID=UPI0015E8D10B|nr:HTTM domain-containing protein [Curtobacterium sp. MCPF17_046]
MLNRPGRYWLRRTLRLPMPWTATLGAARSLLFLSAGLTYLLSPTTVLFTPVDGALPGRCAASVHWMAWPCWLPEGVVAGGQATAGVLCLIAASGWFPALTAVPMAVLLIALPLTSAAPDGGDQLAGILGLLLLPVSLTDWRRTSWTAVQPERALGARVLVAYSALALAKLQIAIVYLVACLGKLSSAEWVNGTALFYWVRNNVFGAPPLLRPVAEWVTMRPVLVAASSWGTLVLEFSLAIAVLLPTPFRLRILLPIALLFHLAIWLVLGVSSFAFVMGAALLILVVPVGWSLVRPRMYRIRSGREKETPV